MPKLTDHHIPLILGSSATAIHVWQAASRTLLGLLLSDLVVSKAHLQVLLYRDGISRAHRWFESFEWVALDTQSDELLEQRYPRVDISQLVIGHSKRLKSIHIKNGNRQVGHFVAMKIEHS